MSWMSGFRPDLSVFVARRSCLLVMMGCVVGICEPATRMTERAVPDGSGHILYMPVPPDVSRGDVAFGGNGLKHRLHRLAADTLRSFGPQAPDIVLLVDRDGIPILPELEAARKQVRPPENELAFTFDSPLDPWTGEELSTLGSAINAFYPTLKEIYGNPAFSITVNVRKDPAITSAGLYNPSLNEIVIAGISTVDPLCHEIIHAFRDDNIIGLSTFEEGMARAAEIEAFNRHPEYSHWDARHGYTYDMYYEALSRPLIGSSGGNMFLGYVSTLLRYQLAGYAWGKVVLENPNFLAEFNASLYDRTLTDSSAAWNEASLLAMAAGVQTKVEGKDFGRWYAQQGVLITSPPLGYGIYQRINQFTVDCFLREASGAEIMQPNTPINWMVFDYNNQLLSSGTIVTSAYGWADVVGYAPPGYVGRITLVVAASIAGGTVTDSAVRGIGPESGVFGVVTNADVGDVTITALDDRRQSLTVEVVNGGFAAPSLAAVKGRFRATFRGPGGRRSSKVFTKDASDYFVLLGPR